jgi:hypothetical protein
MVGLDDRASRASCSWLSVGPLLAGAHHAAVRPEPRHGLLRPRRAAATRSSGSTCSGSSVTPRSTSCSCPPSASSPRSSRSSPARSSSATRRSSTRPSAPASLLLRVGAPPVHRRHRPPHGERVHRHHAAHLHPHRRDDVRLHRHALRRLDPLHDADAVGARVHLRVPDRRRHRHLPRRVGRGHLLHDTYFVIAHFHYTFFPIAFIGTFAGFTYWFPKMFGRMMNETLGKLHFWGTIIPFNTIFLPLFVLGRRGPAPPHLRLPELPGPRTRGCGTCRPSRDLLADRDAARLQVGLLLQLLHELDLGEKAPKNPWNANTLEWTARRRRPTATSRPSCRPSTAARTSTASPGSQVDRLLAAERARLRHESRGRPHGARGF